MRRSTSRPAARGLAAAGPRARALAVALALGPAALLTGAVRAQDAPRPAPEPAPAPAAPGPAAGAPGGPVLVLRGRVLAPAPSAKAPVPGGRQAPRVEERAHVVVHEGRVLGPAGLGPDPAASEGARTVTLPAHFVVTPGLVEAASTAGVVVDDAWTEQSSEVIPHLRVVDEVDLASPEFERLLARGVTTVFVSPSPESVVGARGAVVRTGGPLAERVLVEAGPVKATLGPEAWRRGARNRGPFGAIDPLVRRPTTRMGAVWVLRDALARAASGALSGPPGDALRAVLAGDVGLRVQARTRGDLETALRLAAEAGVVPVLEEATEVRHVLDLVRAAGAPVLYGPLFDVPRGWRAATGEGDDPALRTPVLLAEAGVPFALTAADRGGEDALPGQAALAVRHGLHPDAALAAVTATPAALLGLGGRVGALAPGEDADLVVWGGPPFEPATPVVAVLVRGRVVFGRLPGEPAAGAPAPDRPAERQGPPGPGRQQF